MSSKFGKIAVVRVEDDNSWSLVKADFDSNAKGVAESFIEECLEEDEDLQLQIVRFYPDVYEIKEVTDPRKVMTTRTDTRFESPVVEEDDAEEEVDDSVDEEPDDDKMSAQ